MENFKTDNIRIKISNINKVVQLAKALVELKCKQIQLEQKETNFNKCNLLTLKQVIYFTISFAFHMIFVGIL